MREPTTVVALKGLEKAGLITRKKTTDDRRKTFIHLTPHAKKLELVLAPMNAEIHERSEEHTSELQSLMRISYAVFCLKKKKNKRADQTQIISKQISKPLTEQHNININLNTENRNK